MYVTFGNLANFKGIKIFILNNTNPVTADFTFTVRSTVTIGLF